MRGDFAVKVVDDVGTAVGTAEREIRAGSPIVETEGGVLVEDAAPSGVEERLGQLPQLGLQRLEAVALEVEHLPVEHARLGVLGGQSFLKCVIAFREFAFGAGLPGL